MNKNKRRRLTLTEKAQRALKEAVRHVVEDHRRTGDPLIVWRNGKVAKIDARRLPRSSK